MFSSSLIQYSSIIHTAAHVIHSFVPRSSQHTGSVTTTTRDENIHCVANDAYSSLGIPTSKCLDTQIDHVYDTAELKEQPQYNNIILQHGCIVYAPIDYDLTLHTYDKIEESKCAQQYEQLSMQLQSNTDNVGLHMLQYINVEPHEEQAAWKADEMELNTLSFIEEMKTQDSTDDLEL